MPPEPTFSLELALQAGIYWINLAIPTLLVAAGLTVGAIFLLWIYREIGNVII